MIGVKMGKIEKVITSVFFVITFFFSACSARESTTSEWTLMVFMEASIDLNHCALMNLVDLARGTDDDNVNVIVQWHAGGRRAWRFSVKHNCIIPLEFLHIKDDVSDDLIDSVKWTVQNFPSEKLCLILWNHGAGILEPVWDPILNAFHIVPDPALESVCTFSLNKSDSNNSYVEFYDDHRYHRGILYSTTGPPLLGGLEEPHTESFLTNNEMIRALSTISNEILHGKKIDVLGMDACVMAMVEIGYQIKEYVSCMIGSQDCELADGYPYDVLVSTLSQGNVTPHQFAQSVVQAYGQYYEQRAGIGRYTQSAINLGYIDQIKTHIDVIVDAFQKFATDQMLDIKNIAHTMSPQCLRFCQNPKYVDLYSVFNVLEQFVCLHELENGKSETIDHFKKVLGEGKLLIGQSVIANSAGKASKDAKGISIYFPLSFIDESYRQTLFAQQSRWLDFLQVVVGEKQLV
jgi:hypothetical protein